MDRRAFQTVATLTVMFYMASHISPAYGDHCTRIEYTTDKCRNADLIINHRRYHHGSGGQILLQHRQRELSWKCGSSSERVGFGGEGNRVDFYFAPDGTIKWWIYNCVGCKRVDTTYERCRGASSIQVLGEHISQGTLNRVIKLSHPGYRQIFWYCGANRERTAWGSGANELSVSYFYDGKIEFVVKYCYRWTHPQFCKHYLEV